MIKPAVRWAGGKTWLASRLASEIEAVKPKVYIEPFLGGGAVALAVASSIPKILSDSNSTLMDFWTCVKALPKALINELARVEKQYPDTLEGYLRARDELNAGILIQRAMWVSRAALFLYINARCFNGLWRTNSKGTFNVPYAKLEHPSSIDHDEARILSTHLQTARILCSDYQEVFRSVDKQLPGAAIYIDSPYDGTFDGYTSDGFAETAQRELAEWCRYCVSRGAKIWASNRDTDLIRELYSWASIEAIAERHSVGATGVRRGQRDCVLIRAGQ